MRFAIALPTDADSWRLVRRAEELGFARAWFYDTQMLSADPFVAMAAAAVKTTKIRLGAGADRVRGRHRLYRKAGDGAGCRQARRYGGICPHRHGVIAR